MQSASLYVEIHARRGVELWQFTKLQVDRHTEASMDCIATEASMDCIA